MGTVISPSTKSAFQTLNTSDPVGSAVICAIAREPAEVALVAVFTCYCLAAEQYLSNPLLQPLARNLDSTERVDSAAKLTRGLGGGSQTQIEPRDTVEDLDRKQPPIIGNFYCN